MKISQEGLSLVKAFEGCLRPIGGGRFKAYVDPVGVLTIGWGHTNHHGRRFNSSSIWTQAECDAELASDMAGFEQAVQRRVKVPLTQNQFDALVSFTYNCGEGNLAKSGLLAKLNRGDYRGAAMEFPKWNRGGGRVLPGLTRRRASESLLFQGIPDKNYDGRPDRRAVAMVEESQAEVDEGAKYGAMAQQVDEPDHTAPVKSKTLWGTLTGISSTVMAGVGYFTDWKVLLALGGLLILGAFLFIGRERIMRLIEESA